MSSPSPKIVAESRCSLRFRGRSFLALSLSPTQPLDEWLDELDAWLARSPGFFSGRPVILDLSGLALDRDELARLVRSLAAKDVRVMAVEGSTPEATPFGLPPAITGGRAVTVHEPEAGAARGAAALPSPLVIEEPVRSGQSIFHPSGDVIVTGSVGSGAEIVAGGSIHVYGVLRGRAIAGISGQPGARIFCRKLEAELLAIDGLYKTADAIDAGLLGRPAKVGIVRDALVVSSLD